MFKLRRFFAFCVLIAVLPMLSGCFGSFGLTRAVYGANRNVYGSVPGDSTQRKMAQSAVMWLLSPVYVVAAAADAVIFNVIEFWTGNRVVASVEQVGDTTVAFTPAADGNSATLVVSRGGKVIAEEHMVRIDDTTCEIRDAQGNLKGVVVRNPAGGGLQLQSPTGEVEQHMAARF